MLDLSFGYLILPELSALFWSIGYSPGLLDTLLGYWILSWTTGCSLSYLLNTLLGYWILSWITSYLLGYWTRLLDTLLDY
jgi:hypothetical protein